jgi:ketosteroid isomerase-like protein
VDDILDFFARTLELTAGTFRVELHDVVANDEHAVALYVARGEREGKTLEDKSVLVSHVRDGRFLETWRHSEDQYAADEFLS